MAAARTGQERAALRAVAVLTAIFISELLLQNGAFSFSLSNPRLIAGLAAMIIAWPTRNTLWTIARGMVAFWLLRMIKTKKRIRNTLKQIP